MARYAAASNFASMSARLSSCADYLDAIHELHTLLLRSSPSFFVSDPERLISLVEVAKDTLRECGVSVHTFSSCPANLSPHKAAYFDLLLQLQAHSHSAKLDSRDLQVRLSRLLFPLSTQLKVCTKAEGGQATRLCAVRTADKGPPQDSLETGPALPASCIPSGSALTAWGSESTRHPLPRTSSPSSFPSNVMLPPPAPTYRLPEAPSTLGRRTRSDRTDPGFLPKRAGGERAPSPSPSASTTRWHASRDTLHFKRRYPEPVAPSAPRAPSSSGQRAANRYISRRRTGQHVAAEEESDGSDAEAETKTHDSDELEEDEHASVLPVVIPARSPLRRSFGIFCTGKGRGAFSGSNLGSGSEKRRRYGHGHARLSVSSGEDVVSS
ncbi:hypothetical protein M0805_007930 [Coniferiporia weirii]|nr:hypothetical protein M0805_007930 [Coniferiporia weirii]